MSISHHQTARKNHNIKTVKRFIENVATLKYLGTIVTNLNLIEEEIKRLNSGNVCFHSV
jgi:hypothetical protein